MYCMSCYSSHDYWIMLFIAHWNCISVSVPVIFYFEVLLAFMFIFEAENGIKLSSHDTGQINQSASCLKNQSLAGFWMLHEKTRLKFNLWHYLSVTLVNSLFPSNWGRIQYFCCETGLAVIAKQRLTFVLERNYDTLKIWYQTDQCHFAAWFRT